MSAWVGWLWAIVTALGVLALVYKFVCIPMLDEHDRRTRAKDAAAWTEAIQANHALHSQFDDTDKGAPR